MGMLIRCTASSSDADDIMKKYGIASTGQTSGSATPAPMVRKGSNIIGRFLRSVDGYALSG